MDKNKINKSRMYCAADLVLDKFAHLFGECAELIEACLKLKSQISLIDAQQQVQVVDNTGLTKTKTVLRNEVISLALKFSKALMALATVQKDTDLLIKVSHKKSDLTRLSDPVLFDVVTLLFSLAAAQSEQIRRFFITADDFSLMDSTLSGFKASIPQKRLSTTVSKSSTKQLVAVFKETDYLLKEVIDVLVNPFEYQYPDFVSEYTNARIIVGYTGRGKKKDDDKGKESSTDV